MISYEFRWFYLDEWWRERKVNGVYVCMYIIHFMKDKLRTGQYQYDNKHLKGVLGLRKNSFSAFLVYFSVYQHFDQAMVYLEFIVNGPGPSF